MPSLNTQPVIFTDLDGTLLSHVDYRFDAAKSFLPDITPRIAVVLSTSKTLPEVMSWRTRLNIDAPYIVENGSAVYLPDTHFKEPVQVEDRLFLPEIAGDQVVYKLGTDIETLTSFLQPFEADLTNFVTCPIERAMELTNLDRSSVREARTRAFTIPLHVDDKQIEEELVQTAIVNGFKCQQGGRFLHLQGACDKGLALKLLRLIMEIKTEIPHHAIALGDSENDRAMLEAADTAVVVNNPAASEFVLANPAVIYTKAIAPEGWVEGVKAALHQSGDSNG